MDTHALLSLAPEGGLTPVAEGIWVDTGPSRFIGLELTTKMTVIRLGDGGLLVHAPLALTPARRAAVDALGVVTHLYAPNLFHHLQLGDWAGAYPDAKVHAPEGMRRKRPDLRVDRVHGEARERDFGERVEEVPIEGFRVREAALVCRPQGVLLVADLVHNVGAPAHAWTAVYTRLMGFHDRVALSRMLRWTAFSDRAAARASVERLLDAPFEQLVVAHGEPITRDARAALAGAYAWLGVGGR